MAREELHPGWLPQEPEEADGAPLEDAPSEEDEASPYSAGADGRDDVDAYDFAIASY
ncbi:hypothetical protein [Corallococcus sp. EGB]|uniref:hypothetical protein n=1 Tax=Corallococcus sp. EGB TaxID=1521117 RepID=UPI001CBD5A6C|nr:hypothetical protein [Corallococcus sp. EGB]